MRLQEVEAILPDVRVVVDGEIEVETEPFTIVKETIKGVRKWVQSRTYKFISQATQATRQAVSPKTDRPVHTLVIPAIEVVVDGDCVCRFTSYEAASRKADLGKWSISNGFYQSVPNIVADACAIAIEQHGVKLTFKQDGISINCILVRSLRSWNWQLRLTETMLKYELGKEVSVRYGNFLHNALYRIQADERAAFAPELGVDPKTIATLRHLDLLRGTNLSPKGYSVLNTLGELDPSTVPSLVLIFAGALFGTQPFNSPVFNFAEREGFIQNSKGKTKTLDKGVEWLVENCYRILHHPNCTESRRQKLIPYMPLSHLAEFIASSDEGTRSAARKRADELKKEV